MIKTIVFDFCRVFIFPRDGNFYGQLNALHEVLSDNSNYNFEDNFIFNQDLLNFVTDSDLKSKFELYLLTSGKIHERTECQRFLGGTFRKIFTTKDLKAKKNNTSAYLELAENLGREPSEILFIDNNRENTAAAELAGLATITYRNNIQLETEIEGYL